MKPIKRVIGGKVYDTSTAEEICDCGSSGYSCSEFKWHDTYLYRTKKGAFFLAGEGGPMTMWAKSSGNGIGYGSGVLPLTDAMAREYAEGAEMDAGEMAKIFKVDEA